MLQWDWHRLTEVDLHPQRGQSGLRRVTEEGSTVIREYSACGRNREMQQEELGN